MWSNEVIAETCHEANRVIQRELGEQVNQPWSEAPEELRRSILNGVENAMNGVTPEESHENWLEFKNAEGWSHGNVKDFDAKTHPCMVPYHELPPDQRIKDAMFIGIVSVFQAGNIGERLTSGA